MNNPKVVPYRTKTGIKIGEFYEKKPSFDMSLDMEMLQDALLAEKKPLRLPNILVFFKRFCAR